MHLNNCSIAAAYNAARIFACLGFGASTVRRSNISRPRRMDLCAGMHRRGAVPRPVNVPSWPRWRTAVVRIVFL